MSSRRDVVQCYQIVGAYRPEEVALERDGEAHPQQSALSELQRRCGDMPVDLTQTDQVEALGQDQDVQSSVVRRFATYVEFAVTQGAEALRVDLALDSPFRFAPPSPCNYGVQVNSFADLRVDKLLAYYGRAEPRDAVDLYCLLQQETLSPLLDMAVKKDPGFDLYWFAVALSRAAGFPDELDRWPVKMLIELSPVDLKQTFPVWR